MYFVAGVTGRTGSVVARSLLTQGKRVRVLVRDADKAASWADEGAETVVGSLDDEATLVRAFSGTDGAYLLTPPRLRSPAVLAENAALAATFARAVRASRVPHVVLLSSMGAHLDADLGTIHMARTAETELVGADAHVTLLRAPFFMENWGANLFALGAGKLPTFFEADRAMPQVATRDIGSTAARLLVSPPPDRVSVVELSGPREYSPRDVALELSKIAGKPVDVEQAPTSMMVPALTKAGMTEDIAALFREMTEAVNAGRIVWQGGTARSVRGTTPVETVLTELLRAPRPA